MASEIITRAEARALGLKRYFTGRPCKRGHVSERQVSNLTCMECTCEKQRAKWPLRDKDHERSVRRAWVEANREKVAAEKREYGRRPEVKAYRKAWYLANRDRIAAKRAENPGKYREANIASAKAWKEANPEATKEYARQHRRKRRAQAKGSGGTHTAADLSEILAAQGHRCAYCRANLKRVKKHVDHIKPLALGGSNGRGNLQYLCAPCNQSKSAKDPVDYAKSIGLLI